MSFPVRPHGLTRAAATATRAAHRVPAYAKHLAAHGLTGGPIVPEEFSGLPPVTKDGYLRVHDLSDLVWDADVAAAGAWSASSGSSGRATFWPRAQTAREDAAHFHDRMFSDFFDTRARSTLVVDAFAMGTWIGGVYTYDAALDLRERGHRISVVTPGIQADAVLECLAGLGPHYDQVVLAGYPPFVRDVLDDAGPDILRQRLGLLLAGEPITEAWRDHLLEKIGAPGETDRICLIYGTADAGVMGHETPMSVAVRRAAPVGSALADELYGPDAETVPTFVEYDAQRRYVETDGDGCLLFTVDSAVPLIRYRLNDRGHLVDGSGLRAALRRHGCRELAERVDPSSSFLVLGSRTDVAATFYGLNIWPEQLMPAFDGDAFAGELTGRFQIVGGFGEDLRPALTVSVEAAGEDVGDAAFAHWIADRCRSVLADHSSEYRALTASHGTAADPRVVVVPRGTGPFVPGAKQRRIGGAR
ncbi:MAG: hypothetical protein QM809_04590 [Gordonia sp. (in: high G+C Gram-positive bacteria)]|uniref:hypothetical protein n=1 Tax=Gordonia sp. (in: high G+C Gram-positive bacteria) TaxID=84139 RepID=UPI0039E57787